MGAITNVLMFVSFMDKDKIKIINQKYLQQIYSLDWGNLKPLKELHNAYGMAFKDFDIGEFLLFVGDIDWELEWKVQVLIESEMWEDETPMQLINISEWNKDYDNILSHLKSLEPKNF